MTGHPSRIVPGIGKIPHYPSTRRVAPNQALPARFRRPRLAIVGCGDVGMRLAALLHRRLGNRLRIFATTRDASRQQMLRQWGAQVLPIDLDRRESRQRLEGLARWVINLSPPPSQGSGDPRSRALSTLLTRPIRAGLTVRERLRRSRSRIGRRVAQRWVYVSTTGVYGDAGGARFDETRAPAPATARGARRLAAERIWRSTARRHQSRLSILRAPGIYAGDRLPIERLRRGTPVLAAADDVYTNHIHADDLAELCVKALWRGRSQRIYHAVDDNDLTMGDYFDLIADALELPRPPRLPRHQIAQVISPANLSFMSESRRLENRRLRDELRYRLRFARVEDTLRALANGHPPTTASAGG